MPFFGRSKKVNTTSPLPTTNPDITSHTSSQVDTLTESHPPHDKSLPPAADETPGLTEKSSRHSYSSAHSQSSSHEHHTLKQELGKTAEGAGLDTTDGTLATGQIAGATPAPAPDVSSVKADAAPRTPGFHQKIEMSKFKFWAIFVSLMLSIFLFALDQLIVSSFEVGEWNGKSADKNAPCRSLVLSHISWPNSTPSQKSHGSQTGKLPSQPLRPPSNPHSAPLPIPGHSFFITLLGFSLAYSQFLLIFPSKIVICFAVFIFEVGSLICGVAPSMTTLIVGRAIAGMGAAGIFGGGIIILTQVGGCYIQERGPEANFKRGGAR